MSTPNKTSSATIGALLVATLALCTMPTAYSSSYGNFDARSLAMGGASVAAGNTEHAHFSNPALLSFENEDEDGTRNGRFTFPSVLALVSDAGKSAAEIVEDDLDGQISDTINVFNASPENPESQQAVLDALNNFNDAIGLLNKQTIELEVFTGISVSEPADREGGSFFLGVRGMVLGRAEISEADLALLDDYINSLEFVVANGVPEAGDPLFAGGSLVDPRADLTSLARVSSLLVSEWGLAFSKEFPLWNVPVAFGLTPKLMQVDVYRDVVNFADETPSYSDNKTSHLTMNFDLGVAMDLYDNYRLGFAIKDLVPRTFASENGLRVEMNPHARFGAAYFNSWVTVGLDYDVIKNKPIANEPESQELSLGLELSPFDSIDLRLGYRQDMVGERDDILSAGIRYQIWRVVAEATYAVSSEVEGGALQLGWTF
ncbi:MAG: hypothetical protein ACI9Y1_002961 [Lentisphaeria bacterium]|jgi:hypothetical protein